MTERDQANATARQEIAARMAAEYQKVLSWAATFGPGWFPSHRHFLLEKEEEERARKTGDKPIASATVYTVQHEDTKERRHFTVEDGQVKPCESYAAGFGAMLYEPHPSKGFEHQGKWFKVHRYSLCWAPLEVYEPKSAEQLASLRASREKGKEQRADKEWAGVYPLFAAIGMKRKDLER